MKVIFVNKPMQIDRTPQDQLELVEDGKIPYWTVKSEMLKVNETFQQWLKRKTEALEYAKERSVSVKEKNIEGFYIYDIMPIGPPVIGMDEDGEPITSKKESGMMIRYDYICRNSLK